MSHALRTTLVAAGLALLSAALLVALARPAHAAGGAEVRFVEPERFSDAGRSSSDRERALARLAAHVKELARKLPDGQTLKVDVLDVDLAGELRPRHGQEVRVLRGSVDTPHIKLRWSLEQAGATVKRGEQHLTDLGLTAQPGLAAASDGDLPYEKRMLTQWFREQVEGSR
jgi:hypothetical protein